MNPQLRASFLNASIIAIAGAVLVMGAPTITGAAGVAVEVAHKAPIGDYLLTHTAGRCICSRRTKADKSTATMHAHRPDRRW